LDRRRRDGTELCGQSDSAIDSSSDGVSLRVNVAGGAEGVWNGNDQSRLVTEYI
jgi:hypothetical protein